MNSSQSNLERKENRLHHECRRLQVHTPIIPPSSPRRATQPVAAQSSTPDIDAAADSDGWVFVNVAVVDAAGNQTEAGFSFVAGSVGAAPPEANISNYRDLFIQGTPAMKDSANAGMKVHHKYQVLRVATYVAATEGEAEAKVVQRVMEERFRKELGINVHEGAHLAAVNDYVHGRISAKQNEFWAEEFRKAGLKDKPDTVDRLRVYRSVDINAYNSSATTWMLSTAHIT